jgi:chromosomal replication initiation ATPase DnaA
MPKQLAFSWETRAALGREDFLVGESNAVAVAFIDSFPNELHSTAALVGPPGSGKSHLAAIWSARVGAQSIISAQIDGKIPIDLTKPMLIEDVDGSPPTDARDWALFERFQRSNQNVPLLLTGRGPPITWPTLLPDLASRFAGLPSFSLWTTDETLLAGIARKLFTDRQLAVPDAVIMRIVTSLERSPAAIRDFVARADASALAGARPVNVALIRELLDEDMSSP